VVFAALAVFCCLPVGWDSSAAETILSAVSLQVSASAAKLPPPDAAKEHLLSAAHANFPVADIRPASSESVSPAGEPFSNAALKPAVRGTYESARQRKIWYGLAAASSGAAVFDAWTTRRAVEGGYGVEGNPMLRPFAHSNAIYAATQASPVMMDYLGHKMMTSQHPWMRRFWWVPQAVGTTVSFAAGVHNDRMVP
jgi:hypothetical protein